MPKTDKEFDPWALASGLNDDYDLTIEDAEFGYDSNIADGTKLVLKLDVLEDLDDGPEENTLLLTTGSGWEEADGGKRAVREDGKDKNFNKSTAYGLWIAAALESGAGDVLRGGDPRDASIWKGLRFHVNRKVFHYGGEIGDKEKLLPTEFLGVKGAKGKGEKAGKTAKVSKAAAVEAEGDDAEVEALISPKIKVQLKKLATTIAEKGGSHNDFMEQAWEIDGVDGNKAAEAAAMDDGPGSIWADAQAE